MKAIRPNAVTITRRDLSGRSPTGSQMATVATLNTGVPALLQGAKSATAPIEVEGKDYVQDALLIIDGLPPSAYAGQAAGSAIVVAGVTYLVAANGLGAFPDLVPNDVVIDENGQRALVLAVNRYTQTRTVQAQLARGKAWDAPT